MDVKLERRDGQGHQTKQKMHGQRAPAEMHQILDGHEKGRRWAPRKLFHRKSVAAFFFFFFFFKRFVCAQWDGVSSLIFFNFQVKAQRENGPLFILQRCRHVALKLRISRFYSASFFFQKNKWKTKSAGQRRRSCRSEGVKGSSVVEGSSAKDTHTN